MGAVERSLRVVAVMLMAVVTVVGVSLPVLAAPNDAPVTRTVTGPADPLNAPGQSLMLQRVTIAPGAKLPEHFHRGTQIALVRAGVLTYDVVSGTVPLSRRGGKPESVTGPTTLRLRKGDSIVENESLVHYGANRTSKPVVIDIAALLEDGADYATPVGSGATVVTSLELTTTLSSQARTQYRVGPNGQTVYGTDHLTGTSSLDGQPVTLEMLGNVEFTDAIGPFSGFITFSFADGSTIGVSVHGTAIAGASGADATFAATLNVIGGTGRYADAKGSGTFTGRGASALGGDVRADIELALR